MRHRLFSLLRLAMILAVVTLTFGPDPVLAQSRNSCADPSHWGTCFTELPGAVCVGFTDDDGDTVAACLAESTNNDFIMQRAANGAYDVHLNDSEAEIFFCPGSLMPDCFFNESLPGRLTGTGHIMATGMYTSLPQYHCRSVLNILGRVHNAEGTQFFDLNAFQVSTPDPEVGCAPVRVEVSVTPVSE